MKYDQLAFVELAILKYHIMSCFFIVFKKDLLAYIQIKICYNLSFNYGKTFDCLVMTIIENRKNGEKYILLAIIFLVHSLDLGIANHLICSWLMTL